MVDKSLIFFIIERIFLLLREAFLRTEELESIHEIGIQNRKSILKIQSSGEPTSNTSPKTILRRTCIFCNKSDKYMKNTYNKEKLTNCVQFRTDERITTLAKNTRYKHNRNSISETDRKEGFVSFYNVTETLQGQLPFTKSSKSKDAESNRFSQVLKS